MTAREMTRVTKINRNRKDSSKSKIGSKGVNLLKIVMLKGEDY